MEINGNTRRRVAENLRKQLIVMRKNDSYEKDVDVAECGNTTYRNIAWAVEPYGNLKKGNYVHIVELLVDLIDRPTCRDIGGEEGTNGEHHDFFCLSCGSAADLTEPNYCPNCGAEVVE